MTNDRATAKYKTVTNYYESVYDLIAVTTMSGQAKDIILKKLEEFYRSVQQMFELIEQIEELKVDVNEYSYYG